MKSGRSRALPPHETEFAYLALSHLDPFQILSAEHALLGRDFARLLVAAPDGPEGIAGGNLLVSLSMSLEQHLQGEERVIYPVCERLFGWTDGPAPVLRENHRAIRERLETLVGEARRGRPVSRVRLDMLRLEMADHFGKEEHVLFLLMSALLTGTESNSLALRLRAPSIW